MRKINELTMKELLQVGIENKLDDVIIANNFKIVNDIIKQINSIIETGYYNKKENYVFRLVRKNVVQYSLLHKYSNKKEYINKNVSNIIDTTIELQSIQFEGDYIA